MSFQHLGPDPLDGQIDKALSDLAAGNRPAEARHVDLKEDPSRRGRDGTIVQGDSKSEKAAKFLAHEMACFANTPGGGAIILGVADDGQVIGTELDSEWLRQRIYELTDRSLTVALREVLISAKATADGERLLVLTTGEAVEPIGRGGKFYWRVNDNCVQIDETTLRTRFLHRAGFDWSVQPSGHTLDDLRPSALEIGRRFLKEASEAGDDGAAELALATGADLLRRLNLVSDDDRYLTNAGSLLFVETPHDGIDYMRRDLPSSDSTNRTRSSGPLLEQVSNVLLAMNAANRLLPGGQAAIQPQTRAIPALAAREALVNGVTHRDWQVDAPTTVEHIGDTLTVTSPGGLPRGVRPDNIINHPASPRYKSLAEAMAKLRLAEREGIGVDRMVRDMLKLGRPAPEITEVDGPHVKVSLFGGNADPLITGLFAGLNPPEAASDLDLILLVDLLTRRRWFDQNTAAPALQRTGGETSAAIRHCAEYLFSDGPLFVPVKGVPAGHSDAYRFSNGALSHLAARPQETTDNDVILDWANTRGRVSSTEMSDLLDMSQVTAGRVLGALSDVGQLEPSRANRAGRGFHYRPTTDLA